MPGAKHDDTDEAAIATAWRLNDSVQGLNARVDSKATFVLTVQSAAIAAIVFLADKDRPLSSLSGLATVSFVIGLGLFFVAVGLAAFAVTPRLGKRREGPPNLLHFNDTHSMDEAELVAALQGAELLPLLARQVIDLSRIARNKYLLLQLSIPFSILGAVFVALAAALK